MNSVFRAPAGAEPTIIYICASARSGSTLTDMFLGGHPQAASLGELNFLGKAIRLGQDCTCGSKVADCASWGKVFNGLKSGIGIDLRSEPYSLRLWDALASNVVDRQQQTSAYRRAVLFRKSWLEARERLAALMGYSMPLPGVLGQAIQNKIRLYRVISQAWDRTHLIDSSKNQREAVELYKARPKQVKIVFLVRDGRGVFLSQKKGGRDNSHSLSGWLNYYRRALPLIDRHIPAESLFRLRYEELAESPEAVGRRLCEFVGLDFDSRMLELSGVVRHMVNGNETRFSPGKGIRHDERWRRELTADDLAYFHRNGGTEMNRRLGYA